jgi:CubicO group peptidase (beta-lactamase class C family)
MVTVVTVQGTCDPRFAGVKDAFAANFQRFPEVGASLAVMVDGRMVVDFWAGHAVAARTRPWERDTIVNVASCTKGMVAVCAHMLADRGQLDIDAPVATYWPEFAQAGKERVLVRHVLAHQAGLAAIEEPLPADAQLDWQTMISALERQRPLWEPGTGHGYHASTWGFLVGEIIRRVSGRTVGTFLREDLAGPLGIDFHVGVGPELEARCADVIQPPPPPPGQESFMTSVLRDPGSLAAKVHGAAYRGERLDPNSRAYRAAEIPSGNGHGNARAMARVFGVLARGGEVDGVRILSPEAIERAGTDQTTGLPDMLAASPERPTRRALGFTMPTLNLYMGPGKRTFGHAGMGGSLEFADPDARVGFGYAPNQHLAGPTSDDPRRPALIDAVYAAL